MRLERKTIYTCDFCERRMEPNAIAAEFRFRAVVGDFAVPDVWETLDFCPECAEKACVAIKAQIALPPPPSFLARVKAVFGGFRV